MDIDSPKCLFNNINKNKKDIYWQELSNIKTKDINFLSPDFDNTSNNSFDEECFERNLKYCVKRKLSNSSLNETYVYSAFSKKLNIKN